MQMNCSIVLNRLGVVVVDDDDFITFTKHVEVTTDDGFRSEIRDFSGTSHRPNHHIVRTTDLLLLMPSLIDLELALLSSSYQVASLISGGGAFF